MIRRIEGINETNENDESMRTSFRNELEKWESMEAELTLLVECGKALSVLHPLSTLRSFKTECIIIKAKFIEAKFEFCNFENSIVFEKMKKRAIQEIDEVLRQAHDKMIFVIL